MDNKLTLAKTYDINKVTDIIEFSKILKKIVISENLYVSIQGKNYVLSEGWALAGLSFGIIPIIKTIENISDEKQTRFKAEVELFKLSDGAKIGAGEAICSSKEPGKQNFQEFALFSLCQTRAIAKAYRNLLGFIFKLAALESVPAEEMDGVYNANENKKTNIVNHYSRSKSE